MGPVFVVKLFTCGVFKNHLSIQYLQSKEVVLLIKPAIVEEQTITFQCGKPTKHN